MKTIAVSSTVIRLLCFGCLWWAACRGEFSSRVEAQQSAGDPVESVADTSASVRGIRALQTRMQVAEQQLQQLQGKVQSTRGEVNDLIQQLRALQPPKERSEKKPQQQGYREVKYRPPLHSLSEKEKVIGLVCEEERLSLIDYEAANSVINAHLRNTVSESNPKAKGTWELSTGDFNVEYDLEYQLIPGGYGIKYGLVLAHKEGHPPETWDEFLSVNSAIRPVLESLNPNTANVQFTVYPDSLDLFRRVRDRVWQQSFEVGWNPKSTGELIRLGPGQAGVD